MKSNILFIEIIDYEGADRYALSRSFEDSHSHKYSISMTCSHVPFKHVPRQLISLPFGANKYYNYILFYYYALIMFSYFSTQFIKTKQAYHSITISRTFCQHRTADVHAENMV